MDGHKKGVAPTIKELQIEKGEHTIVIKNDHFKAYRKVVKLAPQETVIIEHSFHESTKHVIPRRFVRKRKHKREKYKRENKP